MKVNQARVNAADTIIESLREMLREAKPLSLSYSDVVVKSDVVSVVKTARAKEMQRLLDVYDAIPRFVR